MKRPRHYAAEILACEDRDERKAKLEKVPEVYRAWVEGLVINAFEIRRYQKSRCDV